MRLDSFRHLYMEELRDLYDAECQLLKELPAIADAAVLPELRQLFANHIEQTKAHVERLEDIFERLRVDPRGNACKTMEGLIAECNDLIKEERNADPGVLDAALIAATQKIEHFEIAGYGCARTFASILGEKKAAQILQLSLEEEGQTNKRLNDLALCSVNLEAVEATDDDSELREAIVSALEAVERS
ncbi:MAG: ferritin-like domain-containing protein [Verrucomicrobiota bacterium]